MLINFSFTLQNFIRIQLQYEVNTKACIEVLTKAKDTVQRTI